MDLLKIKIFIAGFWITEHTHTWESRASNTMVFQILPRKMYVKFDNCAFVLLVATQMNTIYFLYIFLKVHLFYAILVMNNWGAILIVPHTTYQFLCFFHAKYTFHVHINFMQCFAKNFTKPNSFSVFEIAVGIRAPEWFNMSTVHQNYVGIDSDKNPYFLSIVSQDSGSKCVPLYRAMLFRKQVNSIVQIYSRFLLLAYIRRRLWLGHSYRNWIEPIV